MCHCSPLMLTAHLLTAHLLTAHLLTAHLCYVSTAMYHCSLLCCYCRSL